MERLEREEDRPRGIRAANGSASWAKLRREIAGQDGGQEKLRNTQCTFKFDPIWITHHFSG